MAQTDSPDPIQFDSLRRLGQRMRQAREEKGLSAEQASRASGLKSATLLRYERGETEPGALKIAALAEAYAVCCNWLLGRDDQAATSHRSAQGGQAVADLDTLDAVENAKNEDDMDRLILWRPPPILAVVSVPFRQRVVAGQEALGIGAYILDKLQGVAPKTHRRWAAQHLIGASR